MKSKTSFSKLTPLKKDITRFAPLWGLYLVGVLMVLVNYMTGYQYDRAARQLPGTIMAFGVVNLVYAAICAQLLFGDLFNTKMCYSLHALPQRRESWLLSHFAAGILFSLVPNLAVCLMLMPILGNMSYLLLYALLAMELQFLFFFGVAMVSVMVTGNRFAMLLVYAGLNFVSMLVWWVADTIYLPLLPGVELDMAPFTRLCPAAELFNFDYMEFERVYLYDKQGYMEEYVYEFRGLTDGWGYLTVLAVLGLVLMGLAVLLYRWRHLESAGDFVAFGKLKAPMAVAITVCAGGVAAFMGDFVFGGSVWLWLLVGIVVGYFGGMMLLERRIKVFRVRNIVGFAVLAAVLVCSYLLAYFDAFGLVHWVPEKDQVKSVTIANYNSDKYSYDVSYGNRVIVTLEDPEEIGDIIAAHQDIVDRLEEQRNSTHRVIIIYKLESGRTVKRSYYSAPAEGINYEIVSKYFYTARQILGYDDWDEFVKNMEMLSANGNDVPRAHYEEVLEALRADCTEGQIRMSGDVKEIAGYIYYQSGTTYRDLVVLSGAEKTIAVLGKPEIVLGYADWQAFLEDVAYMNVSGMAVDQEDYAGLLEAIKADCQRGDLNVLNEKEGLYWVEYQGGSVYRQLTIPASAKETIAYIEKRVMENKYPQG